MGSRALSLLYALVVELDPGVRPLDLLAPYALELLRPGGQTGRGIESKRVERVEDRVG
jgi:hypothetical protein